MANNQLAQQQTPPPKTARVRQRSRKAAPPAGETSRSKQAKPDRQRRNSASSIRVNPFVKLIQKRPLVVWSSLWITVLAAGGLAILGLTHPGYQEKAESSQSETEQPTQTTILQPQNDGKTPAWLYGAIALGCATGSWVIIKQLNSSRKRRLLRKPLKARQKSRQAAPPQRQKAAASPNRAGGTPKKSPKPTLPKQSVPPSEQMAAGQSQQPSPANSQTKLANSMDWRKRQPLSSLLRKR